MALEMPLPGRREANELRPVSDVPLGNARERHAVARKLLASGIDPMEKRNAEKAAAALGDTSSFRARVLL